MDMISILILSSLSSIVIGGGSYYGSYPTSPSYSSSLRYSPSSYSLTDSYSRPSYRSPVYRVDDYSSRGSYTPSNYVTKDYALRGTSYPTDNYAIKDTIRRTDYPTDYAVVDSIRRTDYPTDTYSVKEAIRRTDPYDYTTRGSTYVGGNDNYIGLRRSDYVRGGYRGNEYVDRDSYTIKAALRGGYDSYANRGSSYVRPSYTAPSYASGIRRAEDSSLRNEIYREVYNKALSNALRDANSYVRPETYAADSYAAKAEYRSSGGRYRGEYGMYMPGGGYARSPLSKDYVRAPLDYKVPNYQNIAPVKVSNGYGSIGYYDRLPERRVITPYVPEELPTSVPQPVPPAPSMPLVNTLSDSMTSDSIRSDQFAIPPSTTTPTSVLLTGDFVNEEGDMLEGRRVSLSLNQDSQSVSSKKAPEIASITNDEVQDFLQGMSDIQSKHRRI